MKTPLTRILLLLTTGLILVFLIACGPAVLPEIVTTTPSSTLELLATPTAETPTPPAIFTQTPACPGISGPCPPDSLTMTAAMGATFAAIPTNTPPAWATIVPVAGDLGWGSVSGIIVDGATMLPLEGATVTCEQFSYRSPYKCDGTTVTNSDGIYSFVPVFIHDTDRITLLVEAPGYEPLRFEESFLTLPDVQINLGLFPAGYQTPTPVIMCSPPPCSNGVLTCGVQGGCPGGCGTICMPFTSTP